MQKWVQSFKGQTIKAFEKFNLDKRILKAIEEEGYENPTDIQKKAIPIAIKKIDILASAQSGTGKTAAFTLPMLEAMKDHNKQDRVLRGLIIVPTRELAMQISKSISHYGRHVNIKHTEVFGGVSHKEQLRKINNGIDILIATPGRLIDHMQKEMIDLSSVNTVILDEADTMLDMGFVKDIESILEQISPKRQIMMFSATLNQNVKKLAKEFLRSPETIAIHKERSTVDIIDHEVYKCDSTRKTQMLSYLIGSKNYNQVLVFVNTKKAANDITEHFNLDGLKTACIHGDIKQPARARALRQFKSGELQVLVATDIAARGIDIEQLPFVVNYELPETTDDFTHRVGRTGRAGHSGCAITILSPNEYKQMAAIEKELILNIPRQVLDGFELTEKEPRMIHRKRKSLSERKGLVKKKPQERQAKKSKKTTKRDSNRSFRK